MSKKIESILCKLWNKALVAEKKDYDPDGEIDQATLAILSVFKAKFKEMVEKGLPEKIQYLKADCTKSDVYNVVIEECRANLLKMIEAEDTEAKSDNE